MASLGSGFCGLGFIVPSHPLLSSSQMLNTVVRVIKYLSDPRDLPGKQASGGLGIAEWRGWFSGRVVGACHGYCPAGMEGLQGNQ